MTGPPRRTHGFTIIEVGIVVAAIAILAIGVMTLRGFKSSAKVGATIQMVKTLQEASRAWAERYRSSASFSGINLQVLYDDDLVQTVRTPWGDVPNLTADGSSEYIEITVEVPDRTIGDDLDNALQEGDGNVAPRGHGLGCDTDDNVSGGAGRSNGSGAGNFQHLSIRDRRARDERDGLYCVVRSHLAVLLPSER